MNLENANYLYEECVTKSEGELKKQFQGQGSGGERKERLSRFIKK